MKTLNTLLLSLLIIMISSCSKDEPTSPNQSGIPSKPKNLISKYEYGNVVLKWETPDNTGSPIITKYLIYRKSGSSNFENIGFTLYNVTTYKDTSAIIFYLYSYYVTAINTDGESERSNEITASPFPGINNTVFSITFGSQALFAGGTFTTAGEINANSIARWDGSNWSALGSGLNYSVLSIATRDNYVYAGGTFTTTGGVSANKIAKWDGSNWSALGSGLNSDVYTIATNDNDVYAGGNFTTAGGQSVNNIAKWNGTSWSALGSGLNSEVYTIATNGLEIYAGGNFTTAGGASANKIAKWDGSNWSALGSGFNSIVRSIIMGVNSDVYAGGNFTATGGVSMNYIAKWNGIEWRRF